MARSLRGGLFSQLKLIVFIDVDARISYIIGMLGLIGRLWQGAYLNLHLLWYHNGISPKGDVFRPIVKVSVVAELLLEPSALCIEVLNTEWRSLL